MQHREKRKETTVMAGQGGPMPTVCSRSGVSKPKRSRGQKLLEEGLQKPVELYT